MEKWARAARASEIPSGSGRTVELEGRKIAIFNLGGRFYALDDTCPHRGGPLGEGSLEGNLVTCPWHGWQYDVTTGAHARNPDIRIRSYPSKVENGEVFVAV